MYLCDDINDGMKRAFLIIVVSFYTVSTGGQAWADEPGSSSIAAAVADINQLMAAAWKRDGVEPAERSDDAEFCRRIWLDLAGVAPSVAEIRTFLDSTDPQKRSNLIDRLLASPQHAAHLADTWNEILLPADSQTIGQRDNIAALRNWLRDQFIDNTRYDYFVASFLTAGGASNRGPAIFYTTRDVEPKKIAAATSKIFLGIQLQCAECHDHPFDRWTQEDFWSYTAFFGQLERSDQQMNLGGLIVDSANGEVTLPDTDQVVAPRYPGASSLPEKDITNNRRRQLTIWLASRDNPYFVRAAVNRTWAHLFGRGLVDPVDAMDKDNLPSHPAVLQYLSKYFVDQKFNLRTLIATLARTDAYQLSSAITKDRPAEETFAVMNVKTMTPRQFYDTVRQNILRQRSGATANGVDFQREQFVNRMRATDVTARDYPHGVMQALGVMNGPEMRQAIHPELGGLLAALEAPIFDEDNRIETLFLATLSRRPTDSEAKTIASLFPRSEDSEQANQTARSDVLWALLNSAEATVCP